MLGAGFLWISLTFLGATYAHKLKDRILILEKTLHLIKHIRAETEYLNLPLQEILSKLSDSDELKELDYINYTCSFIAQGEDFPVAWRKAIGSSTLDYKTDEVDKLLQLGEKSGTSDIKNQISMLGLYEEYFSEYISQAKSRYNKQAKTATGTGILVGCMLFILLI